MVSRTAARTGRPAVHAGRPVASVHVVAPTSRWTQEEAERRLAPAVIECARAIRTSIRTL
nr:IclR family transcriptional regulator C-terminal domain-containing protein [Pseudomonas otitidis]